MRHDKGRANVLATGMVGCECLSRFFGGHCQIPICDGGLVDEGHCRCFAGYYGAFCQHKCIHGAWTELGCICEMGFQPPDCQRCLPTRYGPKCAEPGLLQRLAFSGIVLALLSCVAAALLCCVWRTTRRAVVLNSSNVSPSPSDPLLTPRLRQSASLHLPPPPSYQPSDPIYPATCLRHPKGSASKSSQSTSLILLTGSK